MFIELEVKSSITVHGYDNDNKEIEEVFEGTDYMKKIIAINRIQSVSEEYILVSSSHGRMMYWNYKGTMEELKQKLLRIDVKIA